MLPHIAVVDDEPTITQLLAGYLSRQGFRETELGDGPALSALMTSDPPQLVLLDVGLLGEDGFAIARRLRERWGGGIIMLSGMGESIDKVVGLEVGADDYVTKPFELRELVARIKAVLRRREASLAKDVGSKQTTALEEASPGAPPKDGQLRFDGFVMNRLARTLVGPQGLELQLTGGEFDLLHVFLLHPGRVLSRDFLTQQTRGRSAAAFDRTIDMMVGRLRKKLGDDPEQPRFIKSVRGAGYVFAVGVEHQTN